MQQLHDAIMSTDSSTGMDERLIVAVVMQESKRSVRVPCTKGEVLNSGLMQTFKETATCNSGLLINGKLQPGKVLSGACDEGDDRRGDNGASW